MELSTEYFYKYHTLAIDSITNMIRQLMVSGFVIKPTLSAGVKIQRLPFWMRALHKLYAMLTYSYSVYNVDKKLTWLYSHIGYLFYTKLAHILMIFFTIFGAVAFILSLPEVEFTLKTTPHAWVYLICMVPVAMLIIPLHELAHALTTKAYHRQVNRMGVGWFWLGPMAFTDTSDMWLSGHWPRFVVNFAGIYLNWILAGMLSIIALLIFSHSPHVAAFIWLVAYSSYMMGYYNLNPMIELDGYYMLMNFFDRSNLRSKAAVWLLRDFKNTCLHPELARQHIPEITYWLLTILFIAFNACLAFVTYTYIFANILPQKIGGHDVLHFRWALIPLVLFLSFAGLYIKMKKQGYLYHK